VCFLLFNKTDDGLLLHDYNPLDDVDVVTEKAEAIASASHDAPPEGLDEIHEMIERGWCSENDDLNGCSNVSI
jgi:hypothetical protein